MLHFVFCLVGTYCPANRVSRAAEASLSTGVSLQRGLQLLVPLPLFLLPEMLIPELLRITRVCQFPVSELFTRQVEHTVPDNVVAVETSVRKRNTVNLSAENILGQECRD